MVAKSKGKKERKKGRVKSLNLKREGIKELTGGEKKKIKGGSGVASSVLIGKNLADL
jgi:hypothetical protein